MTIYNTLGHAMFFGGVTYFVSSLFATLQPTLYSSFVAIAIIINHLITPYFQKFCIDREISADRGTIGLLCTSLFLTYFFLRLVYRPIFLNELKEIAAIFLCSTYLIKYCSLHLARVD